MAPDHRHPVDEEPLRRLLAALPPPVQRAIAWLRRPGVAWVRIPLALLLIIGGLLGFLPLLGFWMVPLGLLLLAEDVPVLRRPTIGALGAVQRWWDGRRAKRAAVGPSDLRKQTRRQP